MSRHCETCRWPAFVGGAGLKVLIGYDVLVLVLVLVRPVAANPQLLATRKEGLTLPNAGNVSVKLLDGRVCRGAGQDCNELPSRRLHAGAEWTHPASQERYSREAWA